MDRPDQKENDIVAWLILGYLCSHPEAKDTAAGIGKWWLRCEGIQVDMLRVRGALEYLDDRGWLTTRGAGPTLKVYGLNKDRRLILQSFVQPLQDFKP
jgi:hypothetical protein